MRFAFTKSADQDLDEIIEYLRTLPSDPALRIGGELRHMLQTAADFPQQGQVHEGLSQLLGAEVRRRIVSGYLIFYVAQGEPREILAVLHGRRDIENIMRKRLT